MAENSKSGTNAMQIMATDIKNVEYNTSIENALNVMRNNNIHQVIVCKNQKYLGIFGYKQLLFDMHKNMPRDTKIEKYAIKPLIIAPETDIIKMADYMYRLNSKVLPVGKKDIVEGIVSESDILDAAIKGRYLKGKKAYEFMTPNPLTIQDTENLGKAITIMHDHDVSRLPVIDGKKKILGIIESSDILKHRIADGKNYGSMRENVSAGNKSSFKGESYVPEQVSDAEINVKAFINTKIITVNHDDLIENCFAKAKAVNISTILVVDANNDLMGIIAPKDIIQYLSSLIEKDKVLVQISGISKANVDEFEQKEIGRMIDETVKKISKNTKIMSFTIHIKEYKTASEKVKYSLRCKAYTNYGLFVATDFGWDVIDAVSKLLKKLESEVIEKKGYVRHLIQDRQRESKYLSKGM